MGSPEHRIYIDEVGNPDLESSENPNHRFLSLTGVIIKRDYVANVLQPEMERLKATYFHPHPDEPVVFHRKEIMNRKPPFESLENDEIRGRFDNDLLTCISNWEFTVISVCLDKKRQKETYKTWRYDPYHYCLAMLLERFFLYLQRNESVGDALAESRGGKEDMRLKASYERLYREGSPYIESSGFQKRFTSKQLKIKSKSNNIAGLQLADLIAHPSRNEILRENGFMMGENDFFGRKVCVALTYKYDQVNNFIYGKKFI